jgi:hypothetical protein
VSAKPDLSPAAVASPQPRLWSPLRRALAAVAGDLPLWRLRIGREACMTHPVTTAFVNAAIAGALALAACGAAALAFELRNVWTLSASLILAATCGVVAVHNILIYRTSIR